MGFRGSFGKGSLKSSIRALLTANSGASASVMAIGVGGIQLVIYYIFKKEPSNSIGNY